MGKVKLEIRIPMGALECAGEPGPRILEQRIPDSATLHDLLKDLAARFPGLGDAVLDPVSRQLTGSVSIVMNGRLAQSPDDLNTVMRDGDSVMLLYPIDGG